MSAILPGALVGELLRRRLMCKGDRVLRRISTWLLTFTVPPPPFFARLFSPLSDIDTSPVRDVAYSSEMVVGAVLVPYAALISLFARLSLVGSGRRKVQTSARLP